MCRIVAIAGAGRRRGIGKCVGGRRHASPVLLLGDRHHRSLVVAMRYPGGKSASGAWQRICAAMPPHDLYIEPFLGGGTILERIIPAKYSIVSDADADLI